MISSNIKFWHLLVINIKRYSYYCLQPHIITINYPAFICMSRNVNPVCRTQDLKCIYSSATSNYRLLQILTVSWEFWRRSQEYLHLLRLSLFAVDNGMNRGDFTHRGHIQQSSLEFHHRCKPLGAVVTEYQNWSRHERLWFNFCFGEEWKKYRLKVTIIVILSEAYRKSTYIK